MRIALLVVLVMLLASGCERKGATAAASPSPVPPVPSRLMKESAEPSVFELPTEALPFWREHRERKPALVLFSFDPFLAPIPEELKEKALTLVGSGSAKEIGAHGAFYSPDPRVLPVQTVSAAIEAGFFSKIYWVFPSKVKPDQLSLATFREQMTKSEFITPSEAAGLTLENGVYSGIVRGIPFAAVHPARLDSIQGSMVVHIDLSYFRGLYENEVTTPLYDLLHQTAATLRDTGWTPLALTLSYSTLEGAISIDTRFLLRNLADIIHRPSLLDEAMPEPWNRRAEALYAAEMYSDSKKIELYRANASASPEDATVVYDLFQGHFLAKEITPALEALDRAVALDPGYAAAYISLAQIALQDRNMAAALELLGKAAAVFPENPFIDLQRAGLLVETGERKKALEIVERLKKISWSPIHHPTVPGMLEELEHGARTSATSSTSGKRG